MNLSVVFHIDCSIEASNQSERFCDRLSKMAFSSVLQIINNIRHSDFDIRKKF